MNIKKITIGSALSVVALATPIVLATSCGMMVTKKEYKENNKQELIGMLEEIFKDSVDYGVDYEWGELTAVNVDGTTGWAFSFNTTKLFPSNQNAFDKIIERINSQCNELIDNPFYIRVWDSSEVIHRFKYKVLGNDYARIISGEESKYGNGIYNS